MTPDTRNECFDWWWQRLNAMSFNATDNRGVIVSEICDLEDEIARLKTQIREGNVRFDATVEALVAERLNPS